ncbi:MAG TPA: ABC transporter substrate-binding protein [Terriglobales bacterium]
MDSPYTPRRIVSLQPSATVILAELGQLDRLAACTRYCPEICPEVKARGCAIIADSWTAKADEIAAARPDLVIASVPYQEKSVIEILKTGVAFLGLSPRSLADVYKDVMAIAGITGVPERGQQIISGMQAEIESVRARLPRRPRPRVYCEEWGKPLIISQPWVAELVEAAGGEFVGTPGIQTTKEAVLAEDPDVIVAAWCGAGDRVPLEKIARERGWEIMRAVQSGRVYCIRDEFLNTPAPTLLHGLRALAAAIHPGAFPQVSGLRCMRESQSSMRLCGQR